MLADFLADAGDGARHHVPERPEAGLSKRAAGPHFHASPKRQREESA